MLKLAFNSLVFVLLAALLITCANPTADLSDAEAVTKAKNALAIGYTNSDTVNSVTSNITLPTAGEHGTSISWESSDAAFISDAGVVTQPAFSDTDAAVTLTATISKGSESSTKSFTLTVTRKNPTDEEAVESVKKALSITYAEGDSSDGVATDFSLLEDGLYDTVVTWKSFDGSGAITISKIASNGYYTAIVNRPSKGSGDKPVTLRATIRKGGETLTKDFRITVLAVRDEITGTFSHTIPDSIVYGAGLPIPVASPHTVTGTIVKFALETPVTGITVSSDGTITAAKNLAVGTHSITVQASSADTDGTVDNDYDIVVDKKSISGAGLTYISLAAEKGSADGITAAPDTAGIADLLVSTDTLQDAVTFTIAKSSGTAGTGTGSSVDIDSDSGVITVDTAAVFTETEYTVTATAKGNYDGFASGTIKVTVQVGLSAIGGTFSHTIPTSIVYGDGPTVSVDSPHSVTGTSVEFALKAPVTGITVAPDGTITVAENLAVGTHSITVQASSTDTSGTVDKAYGIVVAKKSISGASLTYTPSTLTAAAGTSTGNTANPNTADIEDLLVSNDGLQDAVTFAIAKSGTTGGGTDSIVDIDSDSGVITVDTAADFTATEYTVTATAKGNYGGSVSRAITVTVELLPIGGDFGYTIPAITYGAGATISLATHTVTGTDVEFALETLAAGITVDKNGKITIAENLAVGTYSITIQASSADTSGTIDKDYDIVVAKKSISGASLTYTPGTLTVEKGASAGNTANPDTAGIEDSLAPNDALHDAVTFSITRSGTTGTGTESSVDIDSASGVITVDTTAAFTETEYTVTATAKGNYDGSLTSTIKVTVELPQIGGDFDYTIPDITYGAGSTISLASNSVTSAGFALKAPVSGITVASDGTITVPANLAVGTHSITVQASSVDTRGTVDKDYDIVVAKKSISGASLTYTPSTLTVDKGASTGNTANPHTAGIGALLVSNDTLQDAVTFSIARSSGTTGTGTESSVGIDSDSGIITVDTTTVFTETEYTVTATAQGNYADFVTQTFTATVDLPQIAGTFSHTLPAITYGAGATISVDSSHTVTGTDVDFALETLAAGITVDKDGTITVAANLAVGTHSITVQASSADTRGTIDKDYDIVVAKKSISSASLTYTPSTLTVEKGASAGNTATPNTADLLAPNDALQDAVTFSITKSGATGTGTDSSVGIDSDSGIITVYTTAAFTETEYTVTAAAKGNYDGSLTSTIKVTVELPQIGGDFDYTIPAITYGDGAITIPLTSNSVTSAEFTLAASSATGITVASGGTITVPENLAADTYSITVQASSADTRGTIEKDYDIVVAKKSISGASLTYTPSTLTVEKGASTGNTVNPDTTGITALLVSPDTLQNAVTFSITKSSGTAGTGTESSVDINSDSGVITVDTTTAFTETEYTVTATAQGNYGGSLTSTIKVTVELPQISGDFDYTIPASIAYGDGPTISLASNTVTGTSVEFALAPSVTGITVAPGGKITVPANLAAGTYSITVQASSTGTRGTIDNDYDIVVAKKSISGVSLTYTPSTLTVEKGASTGNTVNPDTTGIAALLVSPDTLQDAVTFSIAKTGATGGGTESSVGINSVTGIITVATDAEFTETEYTVTAAGKGNYGGSVTKTITAEVVLDFEVSYGTGNKVKVLRGSAISPTAPTWNPSAPTGAAYTIAPPDSLPPGVAFDENSGEFTGTPDSSEALSIGTYTITAKVNNVMVDQDQVTLVVYARPGSNSALVTLMEEEVNRQGSEGDFQTVDTSLITGKGLEQLFNPNRNTWAADFNGDISSWDVSNVTSLEGVFYNAGKFNRDIGNWDVSNVTSLKTTFYNAEKFNQDIGNWNVSKVTNMHAVFHTAREFNQDISGWNVSGATNMPSMFFNANAFNQNIGGWNVSKVTNMNAMFHNAADFNQNLDAWTTTSLVSKDDMFTGSGMSAMPNWY